MVWEAAKCLLQSAVIKRPSDRKGRRAVGRVISPADCHYTVSIPDFNSVMAIITKSELRALSNEIRLVDDSVRVRHASVMHLHEFRIAGPWLTKSGQKDLVSSKTGARDLLSSNRRQRTPEGVANGLEKSWIVKIFTNPDVIALVLVDEVLEVTLHTLLPQ